MDIKRIARAEIVAMQAYESARGSMADDGILLNANEAPQAFIDQADDNEPRLNRYPAPQPAALRARLAELYRVPESRLLITRGSDEGIDLLTRVFCRSGKDSVVECSPCFGMYRIAAAIQGARAIDVPRRIGSGFEVDFVNLEDAINEQPGVRLVFLTSPNNPTGDIIKQSKLERVLEACQDQALVVMDEAYIEFCEAASTCQMIDDWPNLVVLRTLSKAWAAAALRCGVVVADEQVISLLRRVIAPYPLPGPTIGAALRATGPDAARRQRNFVAEVRSGRADMYTFLTRCKWVQKVWPSEANFLLFRVDDADDLVQWCANRAIRIRNFHRQPGLEGCVRISIGSGEEMEALRSCLGAYGENQ